MFMCIYIQEFHGLPSALTVNGYETVPWVIFKKKTAGMLIVIIQNKYTGISFVDNSDFGNTLSTDSIYSYK